MDYSTIAFTYQPKIALLLLDNMQFDWVNTEETDKVFKQISKVNNFDYYYINEILIIPDPIPRINWSKDILINNLEINCKGKFLAFFHYSNINNVTLADSLTFPEYIFLKNNIQIL